MSPSAKFYSVFFLALALVVAVSFFAGWRYGASSARRAFVRPRPVHSSSLVRPRPSTSPTNPSAAP